MNIGQWVRRPLGNITKWHLTESVVDGDAITRCGRRMDRENQNGELEVSDVMPLTRMIGQPQLCRRCYREPISSANSSDISGELALEDDPTVGQVDPT